jgi:SnoaL-like polyketide cyclase
LRSIPDMKFEIKEVLVSGDRVIVRGEVTGTPAGELFGVPHIAQIIVDKGDELNSLISGGGCGHAATMLPRTAKAATLRGISQPTYFE